MRAVVGVSPPNAQRTGIGRYTGDLLLRVCSRSLAYSAYMAHSTPSAKTDYEDLYAIVVDALRYDVKGEVLDHVAHEVLARLRDTGLSIPIKPSA